MAPRHQKRVARAAKPSRQQAPSSPRAGWWIGAGVSLAAVVGAVVLAVAMRRPSSLGDSERSVAAVDSAATPVSAHRVATRPAVDHQPAGIRESQPKPILPAVAETNAHDEPVEAPKPPPAADDAPVIAPKPPAIISLVKHSGEGAPATATAAAVRPLPDFANAADRAAFVGHLRDMLYQGLRLGRDGLASAEEHYRAARKLSDRDPRLHYGFGLILWKNVRYDDALARFEEAIDRADPPYWPAWQTTIRLRISRRDSDAALQQILELSRQLQRQTAGSVTSPEDLDCAKWMGRLVAYLEQPDKEVPIDADAVARCDNTIGERLSGNLLLLNAYRDGKSELQADFAAATRSAEEALQKVQARVQEQSSQELEQIGREKEQQKDQIEQLEMTAEQWKAWIDEQTAKYDKQLQELTRSHQEVQIQLQQLWSTMLALGQEISRRRARDLDRDRPGRITARGALAEAALFDQLQAQYRILELRASGVQRQGAAVLTARQAAVARYQKATGRLVEQNDTLRKWNEVLANKERSARKQTEQSTPEARAIQRQSRALGTHVPFNPEQEKQRILDSLPAESGR